MQSSLAANTHVEIRTDLSVNEDSKSVVLSDLFDLFKKETVYIKSFCFDKQKVIFNKLLDIKSEDPNSKTVEVLADYGGFICTPNYTFVTDHDNNSSFVGYKFMSADLVRLSLENNKLKQLIIFSEYKSLSFDKMYLNFVEDIGDETFPMYSIVVEGNCLFANSFLVGNSINRK